MGEEKLNEKSREALRHIRNWIMHNARMPSMRELMGVMDYKSPRSAALLVEELICNGFVERKEDGSLRMIKDLSDGHAVRTVSVPLIGSVACGGPLLAEQNIEAFIPVSVAIAKPGARYFFLKANGDSMDQAGIGNGDLILVRQQQHAEDGDYIVALIDDEATVKEYHNRGHVVTLLPKSSNTSHQPIIVTHDFHIQGVVVTAIPSSSQ